MTRILNANWSIQAHSSLLSCVPDSVVTKEVPVMVTPVTVTSGVQEDVCTSVKVEVHESCKCGCEVVPRDCNAKQVKIIVIECVRLLSSSSPNFQPSPVI